MINLSNEINKIILSYIATLKIKIRLIIIKAQKIDCFFFLIYNMIIANFEVLDKLDKN